ncbi:tripartite tricarboxylate transporter substrate-binding protein [Achromobacter mucicolens]|uniref:tripartite tricarboxylate transporter substrate-binding protein n=1 Tax=Achromobacter mucicolens TaxID=1389922 RepID=UPI002446DCF0|nr:tripartite tricarboxylate transporter substrate-binding protein [Achromobacter mucicolens]MDH0090953.1 tripartite tricarboxylate transporter substrate-binding protein [Achromobacter mucicolens]
MPIFARRAVSLFLVVLAATGASAARADWPERPVRPIVPYAAGSGPDVVLCPLDESGLKGFEVVSWGGIVTPAGVPKPVIDRLNAAVAKALLDPAVQKQNETLSVDATPSTPAQFADLIAAEIPRWAAMVKQSGASAD